MKLNRRKPDYEAESIKVDADSITELQIILNHRRSR